VDQESIQRYQDVPATIGAATTFATATTFAVTGATTLLTTAFARDPRENLRCKADCADTVPGAISAATVYINQQ